MTQPDLDREDFDNFSTVRSEYHSYHVTRERDHHGILETGLYRGGRLITTKTGCGQSWEEAEADLERGGSLSGYEVRTP